MESCKIVAEIGCVHLKDYERAKNLITLAHLCGAYAVKFQKRNPVESVPKELQDKPHPNERFAHGATYLEHRENLEFSIETHKNLMAYCNSIGIVYSTSVWDMTSAVEVVGINPQFIKVGSPSNNQYNMLYYLLKEYSGNVHISTGMTTPSEIQELLDFVKVHCDDLNRIVLYHCTSEYPCNFERLYLHELLRLRDAASAIWEINSEDINIGFSNHGYGIACDMVSYVLGATWIERHFVDDRTLRHSDASASLEPDGLRRLCRDVKAIIKALRVKKTMSEDELFQRQKLKGS